MLMGVLSQCQGLHCAFARRRTARQHGVNADEAVLQGFVVMPADKHEMMDLFIWGAAISVSYRTCAHLVAEAQTRPHECRWCHAVQSMHSGQYQLCEQEGPLPPALLSSMYMEGESANKWPQGPLMQVQVCCVRATDAPLK